MTSFQISVQPNRRASARFVFHVRRTLQKLFAEELEKNGTTQSDVARKLNIHRSIVSRELNGRRDISVGRIAEYAWALGREIVFELPIPQAEHGNNKPVDANVGFVRMSPSVKASTSSSTSQIKVVQLV